MSFIAIEGGGTNGEFELDDPLPYQTVELIRTNLNDLDSRATTNAGDISDLDDRVTAVESTTAAPRSVQLTIDGGGSEITTGFKGFSAPTTFSGTIEKITVIGDEGGSPHGSVEVDIWKSSITGSPSGLPTVADSIFAGSPPGYATLDGEPFSQDSTLTGVTTSVSVGDVFGFYVNSVSGPTRVVVSVDVGLG